MFADLLIVREFIFNWTLVPVLILFFT